jgi:hypothetical protein
MGVALATESRQPLKPQNGGGCVPRHGSSRALSRGGQKACQKKQEITTLHCRPVLSAGLRFSAKSGTSRDRADVVFLEVCGFSRKIH